MICEICRKPLFQNPNNPNDWAHYSYPDHAAKPIKE